MQASFIRYAVYFNKAIHFVGRSKVINQLVQQFWAKYRRPLMVTTSSTTLAGVWFGLGGSDDKNLKAEIKSLSDKEELYVADAYYKQNNFVECYKVLEKYESTTKDHEILWRLARLLIAMGKNETDPLLRSRIFHKAIEISQRAINKLDPYGLANANVHKWYAIGEKTSAINDGDPFRQTWAVKVHLERAAELAPLDARIWYELGVWHYEAAEISKIKRYLKALFFMPVPTSNYNNALKYFLKAEAVHPGDYHKSNLFYIGQIFEKLGQKPEAIASYKKAFMIPVTSKEDEEIHRNVDEKLVKIYGINTKELFAENEARLVK